MLLQPEPLIKSEYTQAAWQLWQSGSIKDICPPEERRRQLSVPDKPARSTSVSGVQAHEGRRWLASRQRAPWAAST